MNKRIDLMPPKYLSARRLQSRLALWAFVAVGGCVAVLLLAAFSARRVSELEASVQLLRDRATGLQSQEMELSRILLDLRRVRDETRAARKRSSAGSLSTPDDSSWSAVLGDLAMSCEDRVALISCELKTEESPSSARGSEPERSVQLTVVGAANSYTDALQFVNTMARSENLRDFAMKTSKMLAETEGRAGRISFRAKGTLR
ncbi:hypothetical protein JW916_01525 [Candidatus Sumerlaeota bacterium]|nr:hypothetical protein [Candidatus Sumerlaeota bacterium]